MYLQKQDLPRFRRFLKFAVAQIKAAIYLKGAFSLHLLDDFGRYNFEYSIPPGLLWENTPDWGLCRILHKINKARYYSRHGHSRHKQSSLYIFP